MIWNKRLKLLTLSFKRFNSKRMISYFCRNRWQDKSMMNKQRCMMFASKRKNNKKSKVIKKQISYRNSIVILRVCKINLTRANKLLLSFKMRSTKSSLHPILSLRSMSKRFQCCSLILRHLSKGFKVLISLSCSRLRRTSYRMSYPRSILLPSVKVCLSQISQQKTLS